MKQDELNIEFFFEEKKIKIFSLYLIHPNLKLISRFNQKLKPTVNKLFTMQTKLEDEEEEKRLTERADKELKRMFSLRKAFPIPCPFLKRIKQMPTQC